MCILLVNGIAPRLGVHGCLREVHKGEAPRIHPAGQHTAPAGRWFGHRKDKNPTARYPGIPRQFAGRLSGSNPLRKLLSRRGLATGHRTY